MSDKLQELRDLFAAHAVGGMLADPECNASADSLAKSAYDVSDAMIKERFAKEAQWREEEIMRRTQIPWNVGEGYRQLDLDERVQKGDEAMDFILRTDWFPLIGIGMRVRDLGLIVRRKVAP